MTYVFLLGLALVVGGVALLNIPAALIVAGLALALVSAALERGRPE